MDSGSGPSNNELNGRWHFFSHKFPKSEVVFFVQVIIIYTVVITSIVNLSLEAENQRLWISLLSSSVGYLLPNPTLKK